MEQLIDEEEWLNIHGLRAEANDTETENDRETRSRIESELAYQKEIHDKIFAAEDSEEEIEGVDGSNTNGKHDPNRRMRKRRRREEQLEKWKHDEINILTSSFMNSNNESLDTDDTEEESGKQLFTKPVILRANLKELASRSDTVFTMASNRHLFRKPQKGSGGSDDDDVENHDSNATSDSKTPFSLSLCDYSTESVESFLRTLLSSPSPIAGSDAATDIPPEHVIDCCRLAHYLQCQEFLDYIVDYFLMAPDSIDNENCRFLCKLANELSLPRLWEASVNHMLSSLDQFGGEESSMSNGSDREAHLWQDLSPALKREIQDLRGILRSSNRKQVYFSTYHEYLGLLAEQHQYYRERLEDAKQGLAIRLEEETVLRTELEGLVDERQSLCDGGSHPYRSARLDERIENTSRRLMGLDRGKEYVTSKIEKQTRRVDTLKALLVEQKKVFGGGEESENRGLRFETK
mmetsp:Transcript_21015/g.58440  ORF Transcript_21015/g.58440 Transcript_21015/m.58440 type:complete len:463 (-) Transcript_21015:1173-2561(-)